jgi:hypothetical protein
VKLFPHVIGQPLAACLHGIGLALLALGLPGGETDAHAHNGAEDRRDDAEQSGGFLLVRAVVLNEVNGETDEDQQHERGPSLASSRTPMSTLGGVSSCATQPPALEVR